MFANVGMVPRIAGAGVGRQACLACAGDFGGGPDVSANIDAEMGAYASRRQQPATTGCAGLDAGAGSYATAEADRLLGNGGARRYPAALAAPKPAWSTISGRLGTCPRCAIRVMGTHD